MYMKSQTYNFDSIFTAASAAGDIRSRQIWDDILSELYDLHD